MISYEELKETGAHEIHKTYLLTCKNLGWEVREDNKVPYAKLSESSKEIDRATFESAINTLSAFGLINEDKLKKLTEPEPKYKVGQLLFTSEDEPNHIHSFIVDEIINENGVFWYLYYVNDGDYSDCGREFNQYREDVLYPTRNSLIDAQIEYWKDLKEATKPTYDDVQAALKYFQGSKPNKVDYSKHVECEHEPYMKMPALNDGGLICKCKKCGEFYR